MKLGKVLLQLREAKNLTQAEAAIDLATIPGEISRMENDIRFPSEKMIKKIAAYYKVPVPIIFFMAIDEDDVKHEHLEYFRESKPSIDEWVKFLFVEK